MPVVSSFIQNGVRKPGQPSPTDKCPVCGMFVDKYPDFLAQIAFKDGTYVYFDGVKDMFKYYFDMSKFQPDKNISDIDSIYVTDYYDLVPIDGFKAYYVTGSDVYGPMGRELIPHQTEVDARTFLADHKGEALLKFEEITTGLIKSLD